MHILNSKLQHLNRHETFQSCHLTVHRFVCAALGILLSLVNFLEVKVVEHVVALK